MIGFDKSDDERELPKLRGVGDRLIADVAKPSHVADKIFCLVVLT